MSLVVLFLDAFSSRYVDIAPAISRLSSKGFYAELEPLFGFQRVGATMFSGCDMKKHGLWTDFVFSPGKARRTPTVFFTLADLAGRWLGDMAPKSARFLTELVSTGSLPTANCIPPSLWAYVRPALTKPITSPRALCVPTIFDHLRSHGVEFSVHGLEGRHGEPSLREIEKLVRNHARPDFLMIKLGLLDRIGHEFGPCSSQMMGAVKEIDHVVDMVVRTLESTKNPPQLLVFSDHGMTPVTNSVDIESCLKRLNVKPGRDFLYYLNSTVASFNFLTEGARHEVLGLLDGLNQGRVLEEHDWNRLGGPPAAAYGHLHFALEEGSAFFPDFYNKTHSPKGLHGYAFGKHDRPLLIAPPPSERTASETCRLSDLTPTISSLLSLAPDASWDGRSLI